VVVAAWRSAVVVLAIALSAMPALAQKGLVSVKTDQAPTIDGTAEAAWEKAPALKITLDQTPYKPEGFKGITKTNVTMKSMHDNDNIYNHNNNNSNNNNNQVIAGPGPNVVALTADSGPASLVPLGTAYLNGAFVTVTVCVPGTTTCQNVDHVLVDRVLADEVRDDDIRVTTVVQGTAFGTGGGTTDFAWEPENATAATELWMNRGYLGRVGGHAGGQQVEDVGDVHIFIVTRPRTQKLDTVYCRSF
jgi:hypothetical protein